jgi:tripartite-type tricarboxylate transporter receptor subunit TctC
LPQYIVSGWFALLAPRGTPQAIVARLNSELKAAVEDPAVRARFAQQGAEAIYMTLDQSKKFLGDEIVKYHDIITKAGIAQIE